MPTKVSVLKSNGAHTFYSSYADARYAVSVGTRDHSLIQIWADLNETIMLNRHMYKHIRYGL